MVQYITRVAGMQWSRSACDAEREYLHVEVEAADWAAMEAEPS